MLDLLHVALTNTPAIDTAITELAAARAGRGASEATPPKENTVDREQLIAQLGLATDATDEQIKEFFKKPLSCRAMLIFPSSACFFSMFFASMKMCSAQTTSPRPPMSSLASE